MFCLSCIIALLSAMAGIGIALGKLATSRYWPIALVGAVCLGVAMWKLPTILRWVSDTKLIPCASAQCTSDAGQP
jgi:hypothetical protein